MLEHRFLRKCPANLPFSKTPFIDFYWYLFADCRQTLQKNSWLEPAHNLLDIGKISGIIHIWSTVPPSGARMQCLLPGSKEIVLRRIKLFLATVSEHFGALASPALTTGFARTVVPTFPSRCPSIIKH